MELQLQSPAGGDNGMQKSGGKEVQERGMSGWCCGWVGKEKESVKVVRGSGRDSRRVQ